MSCGQKKQNTNEGGVHLTERTCSPYNPIIKQIVDDCLGLPIYPVSSVDAVINEEGRTLRQILEDILNNLNQNTDNFDGLIDDINEAMEKLEEIENAYVSKTELQTAIAAILENLNGLKAWLMLISKFDRDSSTEVVESQHPHILTYLSDLKSTVIQIMQYIGMGDDPSEEGIAAQLANLKALVEEIAKCGNDTVYTGGVTWIVKYVTDLLEGQENLQEDLNKRAHLDPKVLNQKPSTIGEEHYEDYETLKISEYPPTTAKFITESTLSAIYGNQNKIEGLMYFAELPDKVILNKLELYPFTYGINTLSPVGNKLFYLGEDNNKHEVLVHGRPVYVGDGKFNEGDYQQLIMSVLYQESNAIVDIEGETVDLQIPYGRLCFQSSQTPSGWVQYGDYNFDGEVGTGDINAMVNDYLIADLATEVNQTYNLPANYSPSKKTGWISYFPGDSRCIKYPCIEGKLYIDELTGNLFRYTKDKMVPVNTYKGDMFKISTDKDDNDIPYNNVSINWNETRCRQVTPNYEVGNIMDNTYFVEGDNEVYLRGVICRLNANSPNLQNEIAALPQGYNYYDENSDDHSEEQYFYNISHVTLFSDLYVSSSLNAVQATSDLRTFQNSIEELEEILSSISSASTAEEAQALEFLDGVLDLKNASTLEELQTKCRNLNLSHVFDTFGVVEGGQSTLPVYKYYVYKKNKNKQDDPTAYDFVLTNISENHVLNIILSGVGDIDNDHLLSTQDINFIISHSNNHYPVNFTEESEVSISEHYIYFKNGNNYIPVTNQVGRTFYDPVTNITWRVHDETGLVKQDDEYLLSFEQSILDKNLTIFLYKGGQVQSRIELNSLMERIAELERKVALLEDAAPEDEPNE